MITRRQCARFVLAPLAAIRLVAKEDNSDDSIYDRVRMKLAQDRDVAGGAIEVEVKDGAVTLRGRIRSERARQKAEKVAKKVKGVRSVKNELTVDPLAP